MQKCFPTIAGNVLALMQKCFTTNAKRFHANVETFFLTRHASTCMAIMCSYNDTWAVAVGELLKWSRKPTSVSSRYAVVVIKEGMTIGHHYPTSLNG